MPEEIQALTESEFLEMKNKDLRALKSIAQNIINHYHQLELDEWQSRPRTESEFIDWIDLLQDFKSEASTAARLNNLTHSKRLVQDYFADTAAPAPSLRSLEIVHRLVCDLMPSVYQALLDNKPPTPSEESIPELSSTSKQGTELASNKLLSHAVNEYLSENRQKGWKAKTVKQYEHSLFIALKFLGDKPIGNFTRVHGRELRSTLVKLARGKQQADITRTGLNACLTDNEALRISVTTANNHMNRLREFFRWCESMGFINRNPLPDDNLPAPKMAKIAKRDPITNEEAKRIFAHPLFVEQKGIKTRQIQHASHFWMPLIAAYSGMRLGEISQLQVSNIRKIGGIDCFVVERSTDSHYLKTPNAERAIPIHKELIRIGLLDFVAYIRARGCERLFSNIRLIQGNYSNKPSEWFIKNFRDALGLPNHVTPHAFRHSVKDKLNRFETNPENIARLIGHAGGQYGGLIPEDVTHVQLVINSIDYDGATSNIKPISPTAFHFDPTTTMQEVSA
ncbi:tyrosine-type recombinase/integrase [Shewanella algae]|uniref:tyrosine-type recombinase/integrase n=1 Tax=Shewanella algae TaxID=38313 RepID=UPI003C390E14